MSYVTKEFKLLPLEALKGLLWHASEWPTVSVGKETIK